MDASISPLPARPADAHKGLSGDVLIIAGSRRLAGAAALAALGAARSGAGFVRAAVPAGIADRVATLRPSTIVLPQRETRAGEFSMTAAAELLERAARADALVLGPGLGRSRDLRALVAMLLDLVSAPIVLDADGLQALAELGLDLLRDRERTVITPHPGEAAALLGRSPAAIQADRDAAAAELAARSGATVVLKGAGTVLRRGDHHRVNDSGGPAMATAGMGDVLAGMIGALLAAGEDDWQAVAAATWAHGRAADLATAALGGERGLLPEDLGPHLPRALAEFGRR
ncbi:MAG: NAD(P)H-hydrate dehydratase [Planctomycetes bacterium]|nr:NAD(P)H-hydrate dehydratase [Planctomycetota bacterium]